MSANSKIEWTDHTFNPWTGCTKVSPGCLHCYAETLMDTRYGRVKWGQGNPRQRTSEANWKQPLAWNRKAAQYNGTCSKCGCLSEVRGGILNCPRSHNGCDGTLIQPRPRVFCASLADWLDDEVPIEWLADLLELIHKTPNLDWLLLTKRPQNWRPRLEAVQAIERVGSHSGHILAHHWLRNSLPNDIPKNVWIGTTAEDQTRADERTAHLLRIPARVRFLSCEPLLGPVNLGLLRSPAGGRGYIDWVICGGESGPNARPMHPDWARSLRDQCQAADIPFLLKQWGEYAPHWHMHGEPVIAQSFDPDFPRKVREEEVIGGDLREAMVRVGKKSAGRILDGREWNEFPRVESEVRS